MARARSAAENRVDPERQLERAVAARSPAARAKYARMGLATRAPLDRTTQAMLLRQLYLAHFEARRFLEARDVARQILELSVLVDVAHQDAARACQALGELDQAIGHLRLAARTGPASRRAFHHWTLGSLLYLCGRHAEAASALARASRWGSTDKPLYLAHRALVECARGRGCQNLDAMIEQLECAPCGQGYGRFVLGRLCFFAGRREDAVRYLEAFVRRTTSGRAALAIALEGELREARATLEQMRKD